MPFSLSDLDAIERKIAAEATPTEPRSAMDTVSDIGVSLGKGIIGLGESAVGLADIPTMGGAGNALGKVGYDPEKTRGVLDELYSPAQQLANQKVSGAQGFVGKTAAMLQNPSTVLHGAVETAPLMLGGAAIARGLVASGVSPVMAAALGEGIASAGSQAEQTRQETGTLNPKQSALAVLSGAGTGAIAFAGGRIAQKFGFADPDTLLAGAKITGGAKGVAKRIAEGGISEGVFEELPQSMQEQVWANAAMGRPLMEDVAESGAEGMIVGGVMGAGANVLPQRAPVKKHETADLVGNQNQAEPPKAEPPAPVAPVPPEPATPVAPAAPTPAEIYGFARRIADGEQLQRPEDLQFYDAYKDSVEASLQAIRQQRPAVYPVPPKFYPPVPYQAPLEAEIVEPAINQGFDGQVPAMLPAGQGFTMRDAAQPEGQPPGPLTLPPGQGFEIVGDQPRGMDLVPSTAIRMPDQEAPAAITAADIEAIPIPKQSEKAKAFYAKLKGKRNAEKAATPEASQGRAQEAQEATAPASGDGRQSLTPPAGSPPVAEPGPALTPDEVAGRAPAKEPWEMSADEYLRSIASDEDEFERIKAGKIIGSQRFKARHKLSVMDAIDDGLPVPPEVLADYPGLQPASEPAKGAPQSPPGETAEAIFIRKPTAKERPGGTVRSRAIANIPQKEGFKVVYKPYGNTGNRADAGFYYQPEPPAKQPAPVSSRKKPTKETKPALPVADETQPTVKESSPVESPEHGYTPDQLKTEVEVNVPVEETGKIVRRKMSAAEALAGNDEEMSVYRALLECI